MSNEDLITFGKEVLDVVVTVPIERQLLNRVLKIQHLARKTLLKQCYLRC